VTVQIGVDAERIIQRLAAVDHCRRLMVDRLAVERALVEHFRRLGIEPLPVRWVNDAEVGYLTCFQIAREAGRAAWSAAWNAAESAAWSAARSAALSAAWRAAESAARSAAESAAWRAAESAARSAAESAAESRLGIWLPLVDAYEAGLWLFWVTAKEVIAVERPALRTLNDQLHCADGPAVAWPNGASYYFWRGVQVSEPIVMQPETLTAQQAIAERNAEVRRVIIERIGHERFLLEANAAPIHQDETGSLYRIPVMDDEPIVLVHVTNATLEPDGSLKKYVLRVPPTMKRARQAVAWTFGLREDQYQPTMET
jgi:hypothetical protein